MIGSVPAEHFLLFMLSSYILVNRFRASNTTANIPPQDSVGIHMTKVYGKCSSSSCSQPHPGEQLECDICEQTSHVVVFRPSEMFKVRVRTPVGVVFFFGRAQLNVLNRSRCHLGTQYQKAHEYAEGLLPHSLSVDISRGRLMTSGDAGRYSREHAQRRRKLTYVSARVASKYLDPMAAMSI